MTELCFEGVERQVDGGALVPIGSNLPYRLELRTSILLNVLLELFSSRISQSGKRSDIKKKITSWLYVRTRPGFYIELSSNHLHLAYADQRDGHGSQHWWRLFFDEHHREKIELTSRSTALTISDGETQRVNETIPQAERASVNPPKEWGGMYFRSEPEIKIAEKLDRAGVLFFANARGRISKEGSPVSCHQMTGRLEVDFLVFFQGKYMILEVDGQQHQNGEQTLRDYVRDRVLLREGIPTARFTAEDCFNRSAEVVDEFLGMFSPAQAVKSKTTA